MGETERVYLTMRKPLPERVNTLFPFLSLDGGYHTSLSDPDYNCIAHAAGDNSKWWWPIKIRGDEYWPIVERELSLGCFQQMFSHYGYDVCDDEVLEEKFEKIAIFVGQDGLPTHAARQLKDGAWTSKLGRSIDIEHQSLNGMQGLEYGNIAVIMKRPRK